MRCKVSMDLQFCLSEEHFSLDILVLKLAELFETKAFGQILRLVLLLAQEVLVMRLLKGKGTACSCGGNRWRLNGDIVPLGSWAGLAWQEIHELWKRQGVVFAPGSIVVCDGELGLAEGFAQYAEEQRRCQWHVRRDLYHAMHQDGAGMKDVRPAQRRLAGAMAVELPAGDFEKVPDADKAALAARTDEAEAKVMALVADLEQRGYGKAASYLRHAKAGMFGYVRRWLKWRLVSPRASSMIERVMRELGRRIKNIAYGWSDRGVTKIARIILKRFANAGEWEAYWKEVFGNDLSVVILLRNLKGNLPKQMNPSQNFAH